MRIALFTGNYNYVREGANQALNKLVAYLEGRGHAVRVYSPVTDTPAFAPAGTVIPVPSVPLPIRSEFRLALGLPRRIRRDIAEFGPDLVHVATPDILCTRAQHFAKRRGVPIVASMHTDFAAYLDYYRLGWARGALAAHLDRFYLRSDCVLVPSEVLAAEMRALRGDERVRIWSRGVDRDRFHPKWRELAWRRSHGWADDDVVLLFFGRLVIEKGVAAFVETVRRLAAAGRTVRVLAVGAGPAADRFDALDGAVLTGHLDDADLSRAVASADILLCPSTTEAFGNVLLEGMAAGLAVISADAPYARALVEDGMSGLLRPPDARAYAEAVTALLDSPAERARLGAAARAASVAYSWQAASRSAEAAYETLLKP